MSYQELEKNITDVIKEQQIKLGFMKETVRLYYPMDSLIRMLDMEVTANSEAVGIVLRDFADKVSERLGSIKISNKDERFCLRIPPEGVVYVHEHTDEREFLKAFIDHVNSHTSNIETMTALFKEYSDQVAVEAMDHEEFDYVLYFEDGNPDDYRYMVKFEPLHTIYHRFTKKDFEAFDF